mgnify:FL=1|jgi:hypothetical protein|tara:strand:+ start:1134 stop:1352 length:219 start_codon:yes stop_codon:yes gene_type:complete
MADTNPSKGVYFNTQRFIESINVEEKPRPKKSGLLTSTKNMKSEDTVDTPLTRVASYVTMLRKKRQELKNND